MRWTLLIGLMLLAGGCAVAPDSDPQPSADMFAAVTMRIHPIFTRMKDWTGDGQIDGVEALLEFQDSFGDPAKSAGKVIFELFEYRPDQPDARGGRVINPWIGSLLGREQQLARWNRTSRTYSFQLALDGISARRAYVLTATFEQPAAGRFFDRLILEPPREEPKRVAPATAPRSATP